MSHSVLAFSVAKISINLNQRTEFWVLTWEIITSGSTCYC